MNGFAYIFGAPKNLARFQGSVWKSVAETAYNKRTALTYELKGSVKGEASIRIKSVYVTNPWRKCVEEIVEEIGESL